MASASSRNSTPTAPSPARRSLQPITPADQAEAYFLLIADSLSKTTGQIVTVDGGLHEAFLR
jgi:NAD(P)-dependent dehydrogenase (short-subunit alcohol dehydrogenase family)